MLRSIPFVAAPGNHDIGHRDLDEYPDALAYFSTGTIRSTVRSGPRAVRFVPADGLPTLTARPFSEPPATPIPGWRTSHSSYGNAHWTILDSNPYVDWTDAP